jgi:hypothetical protein
MPQSDTVNRRIAARPADGARLSSRRSQRAVDHYAERFDAFRRDMGEWVDAGRIKLREDLVDGLENAPAAFIGLLEGRNFGKLVVGVADA